MKSVRSLSLIVSLAALMTAGSALARDIEIIPGGPITLEGDNQNLIQHILQHTEELKEASKGGLHALDAQVKHLIEVSTYKVLFGTCTVDPAFICKGEKVLTIMVGFAAGHRIEHAYVADVKMGGSLSDTPNYQLPTVINALTGVMAETQELATLGERVTQVTLQFFSPKRHTIRVVNQYCRAATSLDAPANAGCLGGAELRIEATVVRMGIISRTEYKGHMTRLR